MLGNFKSKFWSHLILIFAFFLHCALVRVQNPYMSQRTLNDWTLRKRSGISTANFDLVWFWFLRSFYIVHWLRFRTPRWPRWHWTTGHWGISSFVYHTSCVHIYTWQPVFLGFSQFLFKFGNFFQQKGVFTKFPEIFLLVIFAFFFHLVF